MSQANTSFYIIAVSNVQFYRHDGGWKQMRNKQESL